jgi:hypothetical protein
MWITFLIFAAFFLAILAMAYFGVTEHSVERDDDHGGTKVP